MNVETHPKTRTSLKIIIFLRVLPDAGKGISTLNIHGTRTTNTLPAGSAEGEGGVHFIFNFNEGIKDHGAAPAKKTKKTYIYKIK